MTEVARIDKNDGEYVLHPGVYLTRPGSIVEITQELINEGVARRISPPKRYLPLHDMKIVISVNGSIEICKYTSHVDNKGYAERHSELVFSMDLSDLEFI